MNNAATTQAPTKDQLLTVGDLSNFKLELLGDIRRLLNEQSGLTTKKWMKSHEVRKLLGISPGTLQNLRVKGTLPFTKLGGVIYYDSDDIQKVLQKHKSPNAKF